MLFDNKKNTGYTTCGEASYILFYDPKIWHLGTGYKVKGQKATFICSLKTGYQHGRYVPVPESDIGKNATTCKGPYRFPPARAAVYVVCAERSFLPEKEPRQVRFATTCGRTIMIHLLPRTLDRVADLGL